MAYNLLYYGALATPCVTTIALCGYLILMTTIKTLLRIAWTSSTIIALFTVSTIGSTPAASISISWSANHPPPEGYRVFARRSDQHFDYSTPVWEGSDTSCTIDGLEDHTEYYFVVQPFDGLVEGSYSAEIHYLPPALNDQQIDVEKETPFEGGEDKPANPADKDRSPTGLHTDDEKVQTTLSPPGSLSTQFHFGNAARLVLTIGEPWGHNDRPHAATHWQIFETQSGNCVLDLVSNRRLSRLSVSDLPIDDALTYHWRVRIFDHQGRVSDWSRNTTLNTDATSADADERNKAI